MFACFEYRRSPIRAATHRHPPPYLGITCSRFGASLLSADISGYAVTGGTTAKKNSTRKSAVSFISQIKGFIWPLVWLTCLPPPLLFYEKFRGCGRSRSPEGRDKI